MELIIRNLDLVYNQDNVITDVSVRFETKREQNGTFDDFNLSGSIRITKSEYDSVTTIEALADMVEIKVKEKFNTTV